MISKEKLLALGQLGIKKMLSTNYQEELAEQGPSLEQLESLAGNKSIVSMDNVVAKYGKMEILHGVNLRIGQGQSLCLIGPNGAGKSTLLSAIYGLATVASGTIHIHGEDVTRLTANQKLLRSRIAYVLQDNSVFPDMTVEDNLKMGGYLLKDRQLTKERVENVFKKYERLSNRAKTRAGSLSGGERRLLEISRALMMEPEVILIDEPSIGLEPRYISMVFDLLTELQQSEKKTIILVEQNAKKGLEFSNIGYVLVNGNVMLADKADALLQHEAVSRLFLGG